MAYEAGTIEIDELRGALRHLMQSRDMRSYWRRSRDARVGVTTGDTAGDTGEYLFTAEVDGAYWEAGRSA